MHPILVSLTPIWIAALRFRREFIFVLIFTGKKWIEHPLDRIIRQMRIFYAIMLFFVWFFAFLACFCLFRMQSWHQLSAGNSIKFIMVFILLLFIKIFNFGLNGTATYGPPDSFIFCVGNEEDKWREAWWWDMVNVIFNLYVKIFLKINDKSLGA